MYFKSWRKESIQISLRMVLANSNFLTKELRERKNLKRLLTCWKEGTGACSQGGKWCNQLMRNCTLWANAASHPNLLTWPDEINRKKSLLDVHQRDWTRANTYNTHSIMNLHDTLKPLKRLQGSRMGQAAQFTSLKATSTAECQLHKWGTHYSENERNTQLIQTWLKALLFWRLLNARLITVCEAIYESRREWLELFIV